MQKEMKKRLLSLFCVTALVSTSIMPTTFVYAAENTVFINEVDSDDENGGNDWVEIINLGNTPVDISGWYITDDKDTERVEEGATWPLSEGTILEAGGILVLEDAVNFDFGLGKSDTVHLYNAEGQMLDFYSWSGHAAGAYARVIGSDEFVDQKATKGLPNIVEAEEEKPLVGEVVINEVNSSPEVWVELVNRGTAELDISGYELRDSNKNNRFKLSDGIILDAGEYLMIEPDTMGLIYDAETDTYSEGAFKDIITLDSKDSMRLYNAEGNKIDTCKWDEHASYEGDESAASYGRYPDGIGSTFVLVKETKNSENEWYKPQIVINEVESEDGDDADWVEVYNIGSFPVDLSGWYLYDDDPVGHKNDIMPVEEGTILNPGEFFVFDVMVHYIFYLGKVDEVNIYNQDGILIDTFSWDGHADGVFARVPDGTGEFVDFPEQTKGMPNIITNKVKLNEIQSNDPNGGTDWIELANPTGDALDISGIVIKNSNDENAYVIPEGTMIPGYGFIVITADELGFALGENDSVRLYEENLLIENAAWEGHTNPTWGLYPDMFGKEYQSTKEATKGTANKFAGIPNVVAWPGDETITIYDTEPTFAADASGLDFYNGQLYGIENGSGLMWILNVEKDGSMSMVDGFEKGKAIRFQKDTDNDSAPGPDTEGITVDGDGYVYIASERDNYAKGANYNVILKVDPKEEGSSLVTLQEWDITASLPKVAANAGIESIEWVSNADVEGLLYDQNTDAAYDPANYPEAITGGVFFVGLEDNGHVYTYVLYEDGTFEQLSDIDSKLGGVMALDYDVDEKVLWAIADNGYGNRTAIISLTGNESPFVVHVIPPTGIDVSGNHEGFAIVDNSYAVDGKKNVYRFEDGVDVGALSIGSIDCGYASSLMLPYEDVSEFDWFYDAVYYNYVIKTMTGIDKTHFGPFENLYRGQLAMILYRMEGEPTVNAENTFKDIIGDEWYADAVLWAKSAGVVTGYLDGNFGPADPVTREQMVVMMYRYANYLKKDTNKKADYTSFADGEMVSEFAEDGMQWAVGSGIIKGKEDGTKIDPQGKTIRAEAAVIIQRFME